MTTSYEEANNEPIEIPAFLQGTIEAMGLCYRAGEWDITFPHDRQSEFTVSALRLRELLHKFGQAFFWATYRTAELILEDATMLTWTRGEISIDDWLASLAYNSVINGMEAGLDLRLACCDPQGKTLVVNLPNAGVFLVDLADDYEANCTITIWPNLFTDETFLYRRSQEGFRRYPVSMRTAAQTNRQLLSQSLQRFESECNGRIVSWDSERLEGIEKYGIKAEAKPL